MRKHFLLFFLMLLLPLGAWAQFNLSTVHAVRATYPQGGDVTYNAQDRSGIAWNLEYQAEENGAWTSIPLSEVVDLTYTDFDDNDVTQVKNAGKYKIKIKATGTSAAFVDEVPEDKRPVIEIKKAALLITAQNTTKVYGDNDPATLTWAVKAGQSLPEPAENIAISFAYARVTPVTTENFAEQEAVSTTGYPLTCTATATNYTITFDETPVLLITPKTLTVKYGNPTGGIFKKVYGEANTDIFPENPAITYDGFVNATVDGIVRDEATTPVVTGTVTPVMNESDANANVAGTDLLTDKLAYPVSFATSTLSAGNNYTIVYEPRTVWIKQKEINTADFSFAKVDAEATYTYNGADQKETVFSNFKAYTGTEVATRTELAAANYTLTVNQNEGVAKKAGNYTVKLEGKGNYGGTIDAVGPFAFSIAPKTLNVIVLNETKEYDGQPVAQPTTGWKVSYSGFIGDENEDMVGFKKATVSITSAAANVKDGGYEIKLSQPATANDNYTLSLTDGKFFVTPLTGVKVKATNMSKVYGSADPGFALEIDATGTTPVAADVAALTNIANIAVTRIAKTGDTKEEAVGKYTEVLVPDWTDDGKALAVYKNYGVSFVNGDFEITGKKVTIITIGDAKIYGNPDNYGSGVQATNTTIAVAGIADGDNIDDVIATYPTLTREEGEDVGYYNITIKEGTLALKDNYTLEDVEYSYGRLHILPASLTITPLEQAVAKKDDAGDPDPELDQAAVKFIGLKNGDTPEKIAYTVGYNGVIDFTDPGTKVGGIKVTAPEAADGKQNKNYTINAELQTCDLIVSDGETTVMNLLATDPDLAAKITANNGKKVNVKTTLNRGNSTIASYNDGWRAGEWNALVLPFEISVKDLSKALGYAIINVVDPSKAYVAENGVGKVGFKLEMGYNDEKLPANTPIMVKTSDAIAADRVIDFGPQTIVAPTEGISVAASTTESGLNFKFTGTYETITVNNEKSYIQFLAGNDTKANDLKKITKDGSSFNIIPYNAFLEIPAASGAHSIEISFEEIDGSTTVIRSIVDENNDKMNAEGWYNLNGVKLNAAPTQKGLYIHNGKKVIIK